MIMVIPTYNEVDNILTVVRRLRAAVPATDVLIVDDNSPDGTGKLADQLAADDAAVHVLHRTDKAGLGAAYLAGFAWAMARGYERIGEMDADGSHLPEQLPVLVAALEHADLVIGSRYVSGGAIENWSRRRELISRSGNLYVRLLLGMPVRDATAGFRLFRREALERIDLTKVESQGYVFQADLAFRVWDAELRVREVPITFVERVHGESKMTGDVAAESLRRITRWGIAERRRQLRVLRGKQPRRQRR
jgi:dolichol-phosphate mannosyltransferase